jgi:hypothetical protein
MVIVPLAWTGEHLGTSGLLTELGWSLQMEKHLLPRLIVKGVGLEARAVILLIDHHLAMIVDESTVSKKRNQQNHVAVESHHTGRSPSHSWYYSTICFKSKSGITM